MDLDFGSARGLETACIVIPTASSVTLDLGYPIKIKNIGFSCGSSTLTIIEYDRQSPISASANYRQNQFYLVTGGNGQLFNIDVITRRLIITQSLGAASVYLNIFYEILGYD